MHFRLMDRPPYVVRSVAKNNQSRTDDINSQR
jgi:hypothetical protein